MPDVLTGVVYRHVPSLRRYAMARTRDPTESDDLVQECLKRALAAVRNGHRIANPHAYLFAILRNLISTTLARRRSTAEVVSADFATEDIGCPPSQAARMELGDLLVALEKLPAEQREIVLLVGFDGASYKAAAEILHIPLGTVMSRLNRGRRALRQMLEGRTSWIPQLVAKGQGRPAF